MSIHVVLRHWLHKKSNYMKNNLIKWNCANMYNIHAIILNKCCYPLLWQHRSQNPPSSAYLYNKSLSIKGSHIFPLMNSAYIKGTFSGSLVCPLYTGLTVIIFLLVTCKQHVLLYPLTAKKFEKDIVNVFLTLHSNLVSFDLLDIWQLTKL